MEIGGIRLGDAVNRLVLSRYVGDRAGFRFVKRRRRVVHRKMPGFDSTCFDSGPRSVCEMLRHPGYSPLMPPFRRS